MRITLGSGLSCSEKGIAVELCTALRDASAYVVMVVFAQSHTGKSLLKCLQS